MNFTYDVAGKIHTVRIDKVRSDAIRVSIDQGEPLEVRGIHSTPGTIEFEVSGMRRRLHVARSGETRFVANGSDVYELHAAERGSDSKRTSVSGGQAGSGLEAAMPGQVISVAVMDGDVVTKGQTLVILEAMKMELRVQAPYAGRVQRVLVKTGQVVERGQQLVEIAAT
jgi:biotin carboxyl carrier protein